LNKLWIIYITITSRESDGRTPLEEAMGGIRTRDDRQGYGIWELNNPLYKLTTFLN
jgi:hypothetical protein